MNNKTSDESVVNMELIEMIKRYTHSEVTIKDGKIIVGGWLDLSNTKITKLPENLTVGGWLDLSNTKITELPENLTVGGWLDLSNTKITKLPENLTRRFVRFK